MITDILTITLHICAIVLAIAITGGFVISIYLLTKAAFFGETK